MDLSIILMGFVTTWITIAGIYYKLGKVEIELKYLNGREKKVKNNDRRKERRS